MPLIVEQKVEDKRIVLIDESQRDFVYADKSMIEIVIQNLITNAVKFSRTGDVITVSNQDVNGMALICVEDTGVGISRENINKLFNANKNFTTVGTKNEKGISFVRKLGWIAINIRKSTIQIHRPQQDQPDTTVMQRSIRNKNQIVKNEPTVRNQWFWL